MRWLLDYAAQQAGAGIGDCDATPTISEEAFCSAAMGARNGVNAALVIQLGLDRRHDILSVLIISWVLYNAESRSGGTDRATWRKLWGNADHLKSGYGRSNPGAAGALDNLHKRKPFQRTR